MWINADDNHHCLNAESHPRKHLNIRRGPRVTRPILSADDSYSYS